MNKFEMICATVAAFCGAILFFAGDYMTAFALCSLASGVMASKI
jgi:hypothetical protein